MKKGYLLAITAMSLFMSGCMTQQTSVDNGSGTSLNPSPMTVPEEKIPDNKASCRMIQNSCKGKSGCKQSS